MEIFLNKGIDKLKFGMNLSTIIHLWGKPSKILEYDDGYSHVHYYHKHSILHIDPKNKFSSISLKKGIVTELEGINLFQLSPDEIFNFLDQKGERYMKKYDDDIPELIEYYVSYDDINLDLYFDKDMKLQSIVVKESLENIDD